MYKDLGSVPAMGVVAVATRCVMRLLSLADSQGVRSLASGVLESCLRYCADPGPEAAEQAISRAYQLRKKLRAPVDAGHWTGVIRDASIGRAAEAAARAIKLCAGDSYGRNRSEIEAQLRAVGVAAEEAAFAWAASRDAAAAIRQTMQADIAAARQIHGACGWGVDTAPVKALGDLWPLVRPEGWPESELDLVLEESEEFGDELVLEMQVPDGLSDDEVRQAIVEMTRRADAYHRAAGGSGLRVRRIDSESQAGSPRGVKR
ncbi:MAG: hypothetical protein ACE37K_06280 [Planctomycetota bacterium]